METRDEEIARLERRLSELRTGSPEQLWQTPTHETNTGDPFIVAGEDDLRLSCMPDLVRSILDALPVSVFVKFATKVPQKGRLFTYINQLARERLKWTAAEVATHYDSEAFLNQWQSPLYQNMLQQESNTLNGKASRNTQLEWQPGEAFWRRSRTLEIPIFRRDDVDRDNPIGFCAIAEEVEFKMFPFIHSWLRQVFDHEYLNMCQEVHLSVYRATKFLNTLKSSGFDRTASSRDLPATVDRVAKDLDNALRHLVIYGRSSEELYKAFSPQYYDPTGNNDQILDQTVGQVVRDLRQIFDEAPFRVLFSISDGASDASIKRSAAVKGVLLALIGNARKHAADKADPESEVKVSVRRHHDAVVWGVGNRCDKLAGTLTLRTFLDRSKADASTKELTGVIIGEILSRAFPTDTWKRMVRFPDTINRGWVEVTLNCDATERATA